VGFHLDQTKAMLGLPSKTVLLVSYDEGWPQEFDAEAKRIRALIGERLLDIQHIGSTAIPGMIAKPVIDIAIAVRSAKDALACVAPLESLGYTYRGVPDDLGMRPVRLRKSCMICICLAMAFATGSSLGWAECTGSCAFELELLVLSMKR
jgi:GrpB-like predicted nucleotidyltransferase (UPF0157 family)